MLTSSWFLLVVPIIIMGHYVTPIKFRKIYLVAVSYLLCYIMMPLAVVWLAGITVFIFAIGTIAIRQTRKYKKAICNAGAFGIVLVLMAFRLNVFWHIGSTAVDRWIIPIGISYYALEAFGFLMDIKNEKISVAPKMIDLLLYFSFFPKLISGPIESSAGLLRQIQDKYVAPGYETLRYGTLLLCWGYFEKLVVADHAAIAVSKIFETPQYYDGATLLKGSVLFAAQLYADFDGYTNIVCGLAIMLGYRLKRNFRMPYLSRSVKDFWRRWHISLSTWLKDYVYIPLGGNRKGKWLKWRNLVLTFVISGLWHGSGVKYLVWGGLHGMYQVAGEIIALPKSVEKRSKTHTGLSRIWFVTRVLITFALVDIAWIVFRANSVRDAMDIYRIILTDFRPRDLFVPMLTVLSGGSSIVCLMLLGIAVMVTIDLLHEREISISKLLDMQPTVVRWTVYLVLILTITVSCIQMYGMDASAFIYGAF